jgi:putative resolvase
VRTCLGVEAAATPRLTLAYARVSSHDQKEQLGTQALRLEQHCRAQGWDPLQVITDLGSGMNYKKPGLLKLLRLVLQGQVQRLVLVTKDRLLRFGAELLFQMCRVFGVEVVVLDATPEASREQQLTQDLVEILTVFSSRLYGSRSRKNIKAVAGTEPAPALA